MWRVTSQTIAGYHEEYSTAVMNLVTPMAEQGITSGEPAPIVDVLPDGKELRHREFTVQAAAQQYVDLLNTYPELVTVIEFKEILSEPVSNPE